MPSSKKRKKKAPTDQADKPDRGGNVAIASSTKTTMIAIVVALGLVGWLIIGSGPGDETVSVVVPTLSPTAVQGKQTFERVCLRCHGENVGGSIKGPPLIHPNYKPNHHADGAFRVAIAQGVRQHHWKFGPMPAQPDVKSKEIRPLIAYIREMQRANGVR